MLQLHPTTLPLHPTTPTPPAALSAFPTPGPISHLRRMIRSTWSTSVRSTASSTSSEESETYCRPEGGDFLWWRITRSSSIPAPGLTSQILGMVCQVCEPLHLP